VNFVWQGAALALAAFLVIRWIRPSAGVRYATGVVTLALMLAAPVVTFALLARTGGAAVDAAPAGQVTASPAEAGGPSSMPAGPSGSAPRFAAPVLVLAVWLSGVAVFSLRLFGGWVVARRMVTRAVRPVAPDIAVLARRVAARLALDRVVHIVESSAVSVPVMVGWLKPVVLLPAVALSGLTPTQLEALLAHELAHVRRHDYLVNLLQSAVETLLFYHPAVWWVSKQVRAEREHCCDDLVVGVCDRVVYVSALTDLAAMSVPRAALAATDGSLLSRVRRILGRTDDGARTGAGWISVFVALFVVGAIAPMATSPAPASDEPHAVIAIATDQGVAAGVPGGVPTGVAGGVPGGVGGGVPEGVAGGVPGGVAVIHEQGTSAAEQARQRELELAARVQAMVAELRRLEQERAGLDRTKIEQVLEVRKVDADAQMKALRQEHARLKKLYEVGLVSSDALVAAEQKMHQVEMNLAGMQREMEARLAGLALGERQADMKTSLEARVVEVEKAREAAEVRAAIGGQDSRAALEARDRLAQLERQLHELRQVLEQQAQSERLTEERRDRARQMVEQVQETRAERARAVTDPKETIRTGDVLSIEIKGEPDLPRAYTVQADGTIRLPLLGSIKVAGLTIQQASAALLKEVSRVKRGTPQDPATVHISLRRGRVMDRR
jgi:beta-lactamase regulating signal transducer with metallopeptidase domain